MAGDLVAAAVHHQLRALGHAAVDVAGDLGLRGGSDQRPMSRPQEVPAPIFSALICGTSLAISASATWSPTHTATEIAMQRSPQEP